MKKIAWASKHPPLPAQREWLRERMGDIEIIPLRGSLRGGGFKDEKELIALLNAVQADYCVAILPLSFLARLLKATDIPILWPVMREVTGEYNQDTDVAISKHYRHYRFVEFRVLVSIEIKTEPLKIN